MKRVFNEKRVKEFCSKFEMEYDRTCEPLLIYKKLFFKHFDLTKQENINIIFNFSSDEEKKEIMKAYFPTKYEQMIEQYGSENNFFPTKMFYNSEDEKIHCIVSPLHNEVRHLKLKTDNYEERIIDKINKVKNSLKKEIDKFYGYWYESLPSGIWYITDKNKINGEYRKLVKGSSTSSEGINKYWNIEHKDLYIIQY